MRQEPKGWRPAMPGGYLRSKLPAWPWAAIRLAESRNDGVTSVTPKGRSHARLVFGRLCDGSGRDGGAFPSKTATRWSIA